jgi:hypothetical protein
MQMIMRSGHFHCGPEYLSLGLQYTQLMGDYLDFSSLLVFLQCKDNLFFCEFGLFPTHVLTPVAKGTRIDHALIVAGPLAWLYRMVFYTSFETGIQEALHRQAAGAVDGPPANHRID